MEDQRNYVQIGRKMVRKGLIIFIVLFLSLSGYAQQDPQYSFNMFNHMSINPGFAGSNGKICANGIYRKQWMGFDGAPTTMVFNADMPINSISSGVGLSIINDEIGFEKNINIKGSYAYKLDLGEGGNLGIGLSVGLLNRGIDGDWETYDYLENSNVDPLSDPAVPNAESHMVFDMDFGLFYRVMLSDNLLYAGLSTTHITQPKFKFSNEKVPFLKRHYYLTAGYYYTLPAPQWEVKPSFMIKSDGVTNQYSFNANIYYEKKYWAGATYRVNEAAIILVGFTLPMSSSALDVGIAYDIQMSQLSHYNSGSIEIMLKYCFNVSGSNGNTIYRDVRSL
jgi:type IX secretion system PorP/SprF family membrane protein